MELSPSGEQSGVRCHVIVGHHLRLRALYQVMFISCCGLAAVVIQCLCGCVHVRGSSSFIPKSPSVTGVYVFCCAILISIVMCLLAFMLFPLAFLSLLLHFSRHALIIWPVWPKKISSDLQWHNIECKNGRLTELNQVPRCRPRWDVQITWKVLGV